MENEEIRNQYDAFTRIEGYGTKYAVDFPSTSRGGKQFAKNAAAMMENGVKKLVGKGDFRGGSGNKALAAEAAVTLLRQIRKTAVAIANAEERPGFDDNFVVPRSNSYDGLLSVARTFLQEATPEAALFIEFAMPADFLTKLDGIVTRMEKADTD